METSNLMDMLIICFHCFDAVGWAAGRASRPVKNWVVEC